MARSIQQVQISLNPCFNGRYSLRSMVSILTKEKDLCLNPCFNGRYSLRHQSFTLLAKSTRLNPCFNGRYSLSSELQAKVSLLAS